MPKIKTWKTVSTQFYDDEDFLTGLPARMRLRVKRSEYREVKPKAKAKAKVS